MSLRPFGIYAAGAALALASGVASHAQVNRNAQSSSASHVGAEMVKGRLSSADAKPGDMIVLRLQDDVNANGEIVLRKGTTLTGVVRSVKRAEGNTASKAQPQSQSQSMLQIEWVVPAANGKGARSISVALQSIRQLNRIQQHERENEIGTNPLTAARSSAVSVSSRPNPALLSMPSVMPVDLQMSSGIAGNLGALSSGPLFKVGRGQLVNASGSQQSVDIFSHLNNDSLIIAAGNDFEISTGAQMRLLVGVNKN